MPPTSWNSTITDPVSLSEISTRFGLILRGDGERAVTGVGTLRDATADQISFLANPGYRRHLEETHAAAVILREEDATGCPTNCLVADDPYLAYARIAGLFVPDPAGEPGVHPSAVIDPAADVANGADVAANVVIGAGARIGTGTRLGPGVVVGEGTTVGDGCRIGANVTICDRIRIGDRVFIHPGAVIGADGFGIAFAGDHWEKVPQLGGVVIGDDCEIGANTCIDRGALGDTLLEEDVRLDNLVQIGHNVRIGAHTAIAGNVGVAGSTTIGRYCRIAGDCGISGHLEIADRVTVTAASKVMKSVPESDTIIGSVIPAQPFRQWQRILARLLNLDRLARRVAHIEKKLKDR